MRNAQAMKNGRRKVNLEKRSFLINWCLKRVITCFPICISICGSLRLGTDVTVAVKYILSHTRLQPRSNDWVTHWSGTPELA